MSRLAAAPPRRRHLADAAPHDRLLLAASELFTTRGYAATSVREIVERAGVTKPALYYHYGNKEGICRALVEGLLTEFNDHLAVAARRSGSTHERVAAICTAILELVRRRRAAVRFFYAVYFGPERSAPHFDLDVFPRRFRLVVEEILTDGIASGEIRPLPLFDLANAVEAALNIAVEEVLVRRSGAFSTDDLRNLIDIVFSGIATPPRDSQRPSRKEIQK
jgi:TetR/AcrR family transcriptional regulator